MEKIEIKQFNRYGFNSSLIGLSIINDNIRFMLQGDYNWINSVMIDKSTAAEMIAFLKHLLNDNIEGKKFHLNESEYIVIKKAMYNIEITVSCCGSKVIGVLTDQHAKDLISAMEKI